MILAALVAVATTAAPAPPAVDLATALRQQCRTSESVLPDFNAGIAAAKAKDFATAKAKFDAVIDNCGTSSAAAIPREMRAELALQDKEYDLALKLLAPVPRPARKPLGSRPSWTAMMALKGKGDIPGLKTERTHLLAAVDASLGAADGPYQGRKVESFELNGAHVVAYEARVPQGVFVRLTEFIITPPGPDALPRSVLLTDDLNAHQMAKQNNAGTVPAFVDLYDCNSHVTLKMLPETGGQPPPYADVKAVVVAWLQGQASWTSSISIPADGQACHWPQYVTPGLEN
jgi:hypothetical protein